MSDVDDLFFAFQTALTGRYSLDRELGRGGMGVVYLAREVHLDRLVAIKVLPPEHAGDPALRERFLTEARFAAKLSHPNIIPIHAVEQTGEFVFYAMAFVDGETLAHRVRTRGPLPSAEGARVLRDVAWALAYAHSHGVVHRDVKPDNILIESATGRVLVADFGIAAATHHASGTKVSGTPEFMSPEQALGQETTARSDIYALGITAFYMFSGKLPLEGRTPMEVLAKQVSEPAPPLASMGMPVPRKLAALVDRCVVKDPAQRPQSADAVAEQLGVALEQRRDVPAALRAFVKRTGRLDGGGTALFPAILVSLATAASAVWGTAAGVATIIGGGIGVPLAALTFSARKMLRLGFAHADVKPAFEAAIEQDREERAVVRNPTMERVEHLLLRTAQISGATFAVTFVVDVFNLVAPLRLFSIWIGAVAAVMAPSLVIYLLLTGQRRDLDTSFWAKLWRGPLGRVAFAIAKRVLGKGARTAAITHRATELSLSLAAESLFASLPAATRKSLGDVPTVVERLHRDAQQLRKLHDDVQHALSSVSDVADSDAHAALRAHADQVRARLGSAVGALETIRLNLLQLHAGAGSVASLTTHLDLAADMSEEIRRLLEAREEVDRSLAFPREIAATPV